MACSIPIGSKGNNVKALQQFLTVVRTYKGSIDGIYGPVTISAIKFFLLFF